MEKWPRFAASHAGMRWLSMLIWASCREFDVESVTNRWNGWTSHHRMSHTFQHAAETITGPADMAVTVFQIMFLSACLYVIVLWLLSGGFTQP